LTACITVLKKGTTGAKKKPNIRPDPADRTQNLRSLIHVTPIPNWE